MAENNYVWMGAVVLVLATVVIVTLIIQLTSAWKARASLAREDAYRDLAQKAVTNEVQTQDALARVEEAVNDNRTRLVSIEKMLRDVG